MQIRLFNTLSNRKETFSPSEPGKVGMYVCGPTVYDLSHMGHARCYVAWDVVVRFLRYRGYEVLHVRNFTDVDDKIIRRAAERGESPRELADRYVDAFQEDMARLDVLPADVEPRVTEHIDEIVTLIESLIEKGHAYASGGDVYFAVRSFADYGKLSRRKLDDLLSGARVEPGELKRDPLDFVLWKGAKEGEIQWDSPWGKGRPGWHIECSAMSERYLGASFDIHAGGKDLVFPHHENEIAQSEAASGQPMARYWMHNGFVTIDNEKMSKSLGNFFTVRDLLESFDPQALRLLLLSTHYRAPIHFSDTALADTERRAEYIYDTLSRIDARLGTSAPPEAPLLDAERVEAMSTQFVEAMRDDFNTAEAIGLLSPYLSWMNELVERPPAGTPRASLRATLARLRKDFGAIAEVLGVGHLPPQEALTRLRTTQAKRKGVDVAKVEELIVQRSEARKNRDFGLADKIRDEAASLGVEIMDTPQGSSWRIH